MSATTLLPVVPHLHVSPGLNERPVNRSRPESELLANLTAGRSPYVADVGTLSVDSKCLLTDPELAAVTAWVDEVEEWAHTDGPGLHHFELTERGPALARSEDFDSHHPKLSSFIRWGAPNDLVEVVMGEPAILFKEKINYKQPGGAGFAPHQDASAYRDATMSGWPML